MQYAGYVQNNRNPKTFDKKLQILKIKFYAICGLTFQIIYGL